MTVHTIRLPDMLYGDELRTILWDDEAATVEGDHSNIPWMRERIAAAPTELVNETCTIPLKDPGRDPREFWRLLTAVFYPVAREPLRSTMPAVLRDVELTELVIHPSLPGWGGGVSAGRDPGRGRQQHRALARRHPRGHRDGRPRSRRTLADQGRPHRLSRPPLSRDAEAGISLPEPPRNPVDSKP